MPYKMVIGLLEDVAGRYDLPDLGLRLSQKQDAAVLGALGVAIQNARTVRESVGIWEKNLNFHSPACEFHVEPMRANQFFFSFDIAIEKMARAPQTFELSIGLTHRIAASLVDPSSASYEVWFRHLPVAPLAAYRRVFGVTPKFGMARNGLIVSGCSLDQPIVGRSDILSDLAAHYLDTHTPRALLTMQERTHAIAAKIMDTEWCTQEKVAQSLCMTARTLQRRLREENTAFDLIVDEIRRVRADAYLRQTDFPIARISELLHFKDPSAFTHASRRWFGASPKAVRLGPGGLPPPQAAEH